MINVNVVVIGGGIHGCAAAANAAARGLSVLLVEKGDFASQTSSGSTKLIHGGLRYLEHGAFNLVRTSLKARENLLERAPHLVHPLPFVLPYTETSRPSWQIRIGLWLYDYLARNERFPKSQTVSRQDSPHFFTPLTQTINQGALYFDAQTDDARLTIENALQAKQFGAILRPRTLFTSAIRQGNQWILTLTPKEGLPYTVQTQAIINTSGAWVNQTLDTLALPHPHDITLVKGSHLVLPALYPGKHAYILQHTDKRVMFCIPYHGYTLVGTTDKPFDGDPNHIQISEDEATYLCEAVQKHFTHAIQPQDIVSHWSAVRTLIAKPKSSLQILPREATVNLSGQSVVSLYGGKLTTHQQTATDLINALNKLFPKLPPSTLYQRPFPGAETPNDLSCQVYLEQLKSNYTFLPSPLLTRYVNQYGTRIELLLYRCTALTDLGEEILPGLFTREIEFLCQEEWAHTAEDILWRRTKLGLSLGKEAEITLQGFLG